MTRERITGLFVLLSLVGLLRGAWFHLVSEPLHDPRRAPIDPRYEKLKPYLPRTGEVGYISDEPAAVRLGEDASSIGTRLYLHAQYALAPLVLRYDDATAGLVVANLAEPRNLPVMARREGLVVVAEPEPGVAVLRPR